MVEDALFLTVEFSLHANKDLTGIPLSYLTRLTVKREIKKKAIDIKLLLGKYNIAIDDNFQEKKDSASKVIDISKNDSGPGNSAINK